MNVYLIRHGESMGNRLGKIQGWLEFPLSPLGLEQGKKLAQYFREIPVDYIYSSDLSRAYETALFLGEMKERTVHKWEKVREVNLGPFQGMTREEIYNTYPEVRTKTILTSEIEGAETIEQLTERCHYVVEQLLRAHENEDVVIVSHGGFISIFLMYIMLGEAWANFHRPFQIENTSVTRIEWKHDERKPLIHYINRNNHLDTYSPASQQMGLL
ncbi:histidine phosphatase family protein [Halalkalibacterium ligniniphilum]|uniref:histidine phosphatase family protein n=1 Tax=Halalkalibacterium ligniniphilum TaxID=1134413 RepID=UPI0003448C83|nr:histidine phosphatase family protein [Halalkalibacterium ligniniphilum]